MSQSKTSVFTKIYSIAIILLPFLYQYASPLSFLSLGDFIILFLTFFGLINIDLTRAKKYIQPIIFFSISFVVLTIVVSISSLYYFKFSDAATIFLKILLYLGVCFVCTKHFDLHFVKKFYFLLVYLFAAYLVIQVIYHYISGRFLPIYFKHDWLFSWEQTRAENLNDYYVNGGYYRFRPSSMFLEPGYYALYVMPALFLFIFYEKKYLSAIFIYVSLILSTSGAGILIGLIAWGLKFFKLFITVKNNKIYISEYLFLFLILFVGAIIFFCLIKSEVVMKLLNSFNTRITRSFILYGKTDKFHQMFGVGMNNTQNYLDFHSIYTVYDEDNLNFGASLPASLVQYGLIGFLCFVSSLFIMFKKCKTNYAVLPMLILFVIYALFEEVLFNFRMGFLFSFIIYFFVHKKNKQVVKSSIYNLNTCEKCGSRI